jgi:hypothetical protein
MNSIDLPGKKFIDVKNNLWKGISLLQINKISKYYSSSIVVERR